MLPDYPYTEIPDEQLLALCLFREAEGESYLGKRAVAHVINNRMNNADGSNQWPHSIKGVILARNQFTSFAETGPRTTVWPDDNDPVFEDCCTIARDVIAGTDLDITGGAVYYANLLTMDIGGWFARNISSRPDLHPVTVTLGKHTFFK